MPTAAAAPMEGQEEDPVLRDVSYAVLFSLASKYRGEEARLRLAAHATLTANGDPLKRRLAVPAVSLFDADDPHSALQLTAWALANEALPSCHLLSLEAFNALLFDLCASIGLQVQNTSSHTAGELQRRSREVIDKIHAASGGVKVRRDRARLASPQPPAPRPMRKPFSSVK